MEGLSKQQIDAILSSLDSEKPEPYGLQKKKVELYDFKKALRFSQDQLRTLTRIHENFARLLTSYFSAQLRTFVHIAVASVEQRPYEDFIRNVEDDALFGVFEGRPLSGNMVMGISPQIVFVIFDRLLGGQGRIERRTDDLTEIETAVIERIFAKSLDSFKEAWASILQLTMRLAEVEVNTQFLSMSPQNETVVIISFEAKIGDTTGMIYLCLPHHVLEKVLPNLSARHWLANQQRDKDDEETEALEGNLQTTELNVKAVLGGATIDIQSFLQLKENDVIRLDEAFNDPVTVFVDDKKKFLAQPGVSKGRLAVQVMEVPGKDKEPDGSF